MFMQILDDGPGDRNTVIGRGAPAKLVKQDKRMGSHIVQDVGSLYHLHHKRRFAEWNVVWGTHTSEYLIHQTYSRALCGDETSHLGK